MIPGNTNEDKLDDFDTYTILEVARRLRIGRNAAYDAANKGEIPAIRLGRTLRVPVRAFERLLDGLEPQVQADAQLSNLSDLRRRLLGRDQDADVARAEKEPKPARLRHDRAAYREGEEGER